MSGLESDIWKGNMNHPGQSLQQSSQSYSSERGNKRELGNNSRRSFRKWTADEWQKLTELKEQGHDLDYIAGVLRRTRRQLLEKIRWEGTSEEKRAEIRERCNARRRNEAYNNVEEKSSVSRATPEMWADRNARLHCPRTLTASFFGDPPPGFSALDRKRQEQRA